MRFVRTGCYVGIDFMALDSFIHDRYGVGCSTIYYLHWAGDLVGIDLMVVLYLYLYLDIDDLLGPWRKRNG